MGNNLQKPWASFCMSTYNRPKLLRKTLYELQKQTFENFEVIISDNDPDQSAREVVSSLQDNRFKYYANCENVGMIKSFNKSIERSSGDFIAMITDDDPVYPEMLETLRNLSNKYPEYGIYIGGYNTLYSDQLFAKVAKAKIGINSGLRDINLGTIIKYESKDFPYYFLGKELSNGLLWSAGIIRREIVIKIGGMPDYGSPTLADCGLLLLAGSQNGLVYINTPLGLRSIHENNFSYNEKNLSVLLKAPEGFYKWILSHLSSDINHQSIISPLENYIGREITMQAIFIKKILSLKPLKPDKDFENFKKALFKIRYFKKWKMKYFLATSYPTIFELFLCIKKIVMR